MTDQQRRLNHLRRCITAAAGRLAGIGRPGPDRATPDPWRAQRCAVLVDELLAQSLAAEASAVQAAAHLPALPPGTDPVFFHPWHAAPLSSPPLGAVAGVGANTSTDSSTDTAGDRPAGGTSSPLTEEALTHLSALVDDMDSHWRDLDVLVTRLRLVALQPVLNAAEWLLDEVRDLSLFIAERAPGPIVRDRADRLTYHRDQLTDRFRAERGWPPLHPTPFQSQEVPT
jgi:hypothetical protein